MSSGFTGAILQIRDHQACSFRADALRLLLCCMQRFSVKSAAEQLCFQHELSNYGAAHPCASHPRQLSAVCTAYAEGRYHGMQAAKLQASLPFSTRKRQDLLIWGQSLERMVQTASPHPGQAGGDGQRQPNSPTRQA